VDRQPRDHGAGLDLLGDVDPASWWDDVPDADDDHREPSPTDELVTSVERELGHRLPASYVAFLRRHNGGVPRRTCCPSAPTSWADDHVAITGLFAIGRTASHSLCGELGSRFWVREWGYPDLGVYFADCPSAGHDMIAMDYRQVDARGEPPVVHVDQERDYAVTVLAPGFAGFVRSLRGQDAFDVG
jgi:hypothetical protein